MRDNENDMMTQLGVLLALSGIAKSKGGGSVTPEDVKETVSEYLESHPATADTAGAVKIGNGINVDENGVISLDEELMDELVEEYLEKNAEIISDDEVEELFGDGIVVDDDGSISLNKEMMEKLVEAYLEENSEELTADEVNDIWRNPN